MSLSGIDPLENPTILNIAATNVPEPGSGSLLALGIAALAGRRRRCRQTGGAA